MRNKGKALFAVLIITAGVVLFNYPTIASFVNNIFANREISAYEKAAEAMDYEDIDRRIALAEAYNRSLPLSFPADPFSGDNIFNFTGTEFETFEMVQPDAMIGYIQIPKIDVYQSIYYGISATVLDKGLGLVENTSLPVGGEGTHAVISGHTGMATRKLFTDLDQMEVGDLFFIHVLNRHYAYEVDQILVVWPEETEELAIRKGEDLVTLVTCTPFGINDHRLLVRGHRIDYDFSSPEAVYEHVSAQPAWRKWIVTLCLGGGFLLAVIAKVVYDHRKSKKEQDEDQ